MSHVLKILEDTSQSPYSGGQEYHSRFWQSSSILNQPPETLKTDPIYGDVPDKDKKPNPKTGPEEPYIKNPANSPPMVYGVDWSTKT